MSLGERLFWEPERKHQTVDHPGSSCAHTLSFHACITPVYIPSENGLLSPYMEEKMALDQGPSNRSLTVHVLCFYSLTLSAKNFLSSPFVLCLDDKDLSETTNSISPRVLYPQCSVKSHI